MHIMGDAPGERIPHVHPAYPVVVSNFCFSITLLNIVAAAVT